MYAMAKTFAAVEVSDALRALLEALPANPEPIGDLSARRATVLRKEVATALARLQWLAEELDPIRRPDFVLDPSNPEFVGRLIGRTLVEQARQPMEIPDKFYGSGVYAIYYHGKFPAYAPIVGTETPIYVGKADPAKPAAKTVFEQGTRLYSRLEEHAKSIRAAKGTLNIHDFERRYLVVQSGWQASAENYLLMRYRPIWNQSICYGFGKHGDKAETRKNERSRWDTLHPGRRWATHKGNVPNSLSEANILALISQHYHENPPEA